jgi:tetratricopeptide (TPR) repeat protein
VDILPTITALLQIAVPAGLPGSNLLATDASGTRTSYFEAMTPMLKRGWAPLSGMVAGREKYIDLPIEELYDLRTDPREEQNIVAKASDRATALAAELRRLSAPLPGAEQTETADVRQRLQALGYVSGSAPRKAEYTEEDDPKRLIDIDRLMMDGIAFYQRGQMPEAMDAYRRVIARRPDMGLAYRRLAFLQWHVGATNDAIGTLRSALDTTGPDIEIEIRLGTYLAETGSPAEAIPILERVTSADRTNSEALNALGIAYARQSRPADALTAFNRAIEANPRDVYAKENIGTVYLQQGNLAAARAAFMRALEDDSRSSRAHSGLGVVARQQERVDEAISHWRRAVELDRTNYDALFNLASGLAGAGRTAEARPYMIQFVQTAPPALYGRDIERFRQYLSGSR